jgi:hypothetical protein
MPVLPAGLAAAPWPPYNFFTLPAGARFSGMRSLGSTPMLERLQHGLPLSVVVLGASVAENGGCVSQGHARCMDHNGIRSTALVLGEPRIRPHKGWWFAGGSGSKRHTRTPGTSCTPGTS